TPFQNGSWTRSTWSSHRLTLRYFVDAPDFIEEGWTFEGTATRFQPVLCGKQRRRRHQTGCEGGKRDTIVQCRSSHCAAYSAVSASGRRSTISPASISSSTRSPQTKRYCRGHGKSGRAAVTSAGIIAPNLQSNEPLTAGLHGDAQVARRA